MTKIQTLKIVLPIVTLVAGIVIGSALSTLMCQGLVKRANANTEKAIGIANINLKTAKDCTESLNRTTTTLEETTAALQRATKR